MESCLTEAKKCAVRVLMFERERGEFEGRMEVMDTALVKLLVELGQAKELHEFLSAENQASLEQLEQFLTDNKRFNALAIMYKNNDKGIEALEVWQKCVWFPSFSAFASSIASSLTRAVNH